jgi:hypothetical protein
MCTDESPPGVDENSISSDDTKHGAKSKRVYYHPLRTPKDVLDYVQWMINTLHRKNLALEPDYLGKVSNLLNTWLVAYKSNLETVEVQQLREEIADMRRQMEARDRGSIIRSANR